MKKTKSLFVILLVINILLLNSCFPRKKGEKIFIEGFFQDKSIYFGVYCLEVIKINYEAFLSYNGINVVKDDNAKEDDGYFHLNFYSIIDNQKTEYDFVNLKNEHPNDKHTPVSYKDDNGIRIHPYKWDNKVSPGDICYYIFGYGEKTQIWLKGV